MLNNFLWFCVVGLWWSKHHFYVLNLCGEVEAHRAIPHIRNSPGNISVPPENKRNCSSRHERETLIWFRRPLERAHFCILWRLNPKLLPHTETFLSGETSDRDRLPKRGEGGDVRKYEFCARTLCRKKKEKKNTLIVWQYSPPKTNETAAIGVSPWVLLLSFSFVAEMHDVSSVVLRTSAPILFLFLLVLVETAEQGWKVGYRVRKKKKKGER